MNCRVVLVETAPLDVAAAFADELARVRVLADPDATVAGGDAVVVIADECGEIYDAPSAGNAHDLPTPEQIAEWVQFIAIQCPECEGPDGEWRTL